VIPSLVLVEVWHWTPLVMLIVLGGLASLPTEPYESALIDGASQWQMFRHITWPLVLPFVMVALVIRTIDALKTFDTIFVITQGGPGTASETINIYLYLQAFAFYNMGHASAVVVVFFGIIVALSLLLLWVRQRTLGPPSAVSGRSVYLPQTGAAENSSRQRQFWSSRPAWRRRDSGKASPERPDSQASEVLGIEHVPADEQRRPAGQPDRQQHQGCAYPAPGADTRLHATTARKFQDDVIRSIDHQASHRRPRTEQGPVPRRHKSQCHQQCGEHPANDRVICHRQEGRGSTAMRKYDQERHPA